MKYEIVETPFQVELAGLRGTVENQQYGPTGMKLMCVMWDEVKSKGIANKGLNHWAYLAGAEMFTGVELLDPATKPNSLERLVFTLPRYAKAVHVGPYSELPRFWKELKDQLAAAGESIGLGLEIYGHWVKDESKLETTVLIGCAKV